MIKVVEILEPFVKPPDNLQKHIKHVNLNFTRKLPIKQNAVCHSQNYHRL